MTRGSLFGGGVVVGVVDVNNVKSMFSSISQKNKASRQMKLHTHIHYYAPCPLLSAITDLYLLFTLG